MILKETFLKVLKDRITMIFEYEIYKSPWFYFILTLFIGFIGWHYQISLLAHPFWFIAGVIILVKTGDILIDGATKLARHYRVSPMIVGLTVVAFGTSLPELIVSFLAALNGNTGISLGNVIGSNVANIGLIIGISALILPLTVSLTTIKKEAPILIAACFAAYFLAFNVIFDQSGATNVIGRVDGVILIAGFIAFMIYIIRTAQKQRTQKAEAQFEKEFKGEREKTWKFYVSILLGLIGLSIGAKLIVFSGSEMARSLGVSEVVIGITMIAVGTSLQDLTAGVIAARKKEADIAIGTVVGSNIFLLLCVLGMSALAKPIEIATNILRIDFLVVIGFSVFLYVMMSNDHKIDKKEGIMLLVAYAAYIIYVLLTTFI